GAGNRRAIQTGFAALEEEHLASKPGVAGGRPGRHERGIPAIELRTAATGGRGVWIFRIGDHLGSAPVLLVEAGGGGVIPGSDDGTGGSAEADECQHVDTEVVVEADLRINLGTVAAARRRHS